MPASTTRVLPSALAAATRASSSGRMPRVVSNSSDPAKANLGLRLGLLAPQREVLGGDARGNGVGDEGGAWAVTASAASPVTVTAT